MKRVIMIVVFMLLTMGVFSSELDKAVELIRGLKKSNSELMILIDKKNVEISEKTATIKNLNKVIKTVIIPQQDANITILEKLKKEKRLSNRLSILASLIRLGLFFEVDCKYDDNFKFNTWSAGVQVLIMKKVFFQLAAGYTYDFNIKIGAGFYIF